MKWFNASGIKVAVFAAVVGLVVGTTVKADLPTARTLLGTCAVDGKIYAIGGAPQPHGAISVVEVYDPTTDT